MTENVYKCDYIGQCKIYLANTITVIEEGQTHLLKSIHVGRPMPTRVIHLNVAAIQSITVVDELFDNEDMTSGGYVHICLHLPRSEVAR